MHFNWPHLLKQFSGAVVSLMNILGLKFNERYVKDEHLNSLRYGKLMIMADHNPDGTFLRVS